MNRSKLGSRLFKIWVLLGFLVCSMPFSGFNVGKAEESYVQFRPHMQSVYQSLTKILAFALKGNDAIGPKDLEDVEAHLKNLAEKSQAIRLLAKGSDKGHEFMAKELENGSAIAYSKFKAGYREQAKFFVSDVVNACFGCHTSRSSQSDSQYTLNFEKDIGMDSLDPLARARFLSLSRQFETSLDEYEKVLLSDGLNDDQLLNFDPLVEYLILTLRVRYDIGRAQRTLTALRKKTFPEVIKADIDAWIKALAAHAGDNPKRSGLETAKDLMSEAKKEMEFPRDRGGIVQYILASRMLNDFLKYTDASAKEKAEAYYELGTCELILGTQLFPDEASAYFEESIRLLPKSPIARKAFARYEENILYGYSGSSGTRLPVEEKRKLDDLRKIAF